MNDGSSGTAGQRPRTLVWVLALVVAGLMTVAAVAGLLPGSGEIVRVVSIRGESVELFGRGLYSYDTVFKAAGNIGSDIVTVILGMPLLVVAALAYRQGSRWGHLLLVGALTWPLYLYATMALGTAFNTLFLVYVATFSASLFTFVLTMSSLDLPAVEDRLESLPSRFVGWFMIACGVLTFVVWMMPLVGSLAGGVPPKLLQTSATMVTDALDLAIITPLCFAAGVLLLKQRLAAGYRIAFPLLMLLCVLGPAIVAQTIVQLRSGVSFQPPEVIGPITGFLVLAAVAVALVALILRAVGDRTLPGVPESASCERVRRGCRRRGALRPVGWMSRRAVADWPWIWSRPLGAGRPPSGSSGRSVRPALPGPARLAHSGTVRHPLQSVDHMRQAFLALFVLTVLVFVGFQLLGPTNPGIVDLELAYTDDRTVALLAQWDDQDKLRLAFGMGFDYLFMPVYATTIGLACVWVTRVSRPGWRSAAAMMAWVVWVAALFDAVENVAMFTSLLGSPSTTTALVAGVCATVKFVLIVAAIVFVVIALFTGRHRENPAAGTSPS